MAEQPTTLTEIVEYAKAAERSAKATYENAAKMAEQPGSRKMLNEMAQEEANHERTLDGLDIANIGETAIAKTDDLRIADFLEDVELKPDADFQTVLIFAMKQEQIARDFYKAMTYLCQDPEQKKLFEILAQQEQQHKAKLETIYDDTVLREN